MAWAKFRRPIVFPFRRILDSLKTFKEHAKSVYTAYARDGNASPLELSDMELVSGQILTARFPELADELLTTLDVYGV